MKCKLRRFVSVLIAAVLLFSALPLSRNVIADSTDNEKIIIDGPYYLKNGEPQNVGGSVTYSVNGVQEPEFVHPGQKVYVHVDVPSGYQLSNSTNIIIEYKWTNGYGNAFTRTGVSMDPDGNGSFTMPDTVDGQLTIEVMFYKLFKVGADNLNRNYVTVLGAFLDNRREVYLEGSDMVPEGGYANVQINKIENYPISKLTFTEETGRVLSDISYYKANENDDYYIYHVQMPLNNASEIRIRPVYEGGNLLSATGFYRNVGGQKIPVEGGTISYMVNGNAVSNPSCAPKDAAIKVHVEVPDGYGLPYGNMVDYTYKIPSVYGVGHGYIDEDGDFTFNMLDGTVLIEPRVLKLSKLSVAEKDEDYVSIYSISLNPTERQVAPETVDYCAGEGMAFRVMVKEREGYSFDGLSFYGPDGNNLDLRYYERDAVDGNAVYEAFVPSGDATCDINVRAQWQIKNIDIAIADPLCGTEVELPETVPYDMSGDFARPDVTVSEGAHIYEPVGGDFVGPQNLWYMENAGVGMMPLNGTIKEGDTIFAWVTLSCDDGIVLGEDTVITVNGEQVEVPLEGSIFNIMFPMTAVHDYGDVSYEWADDNSEVRASRFCNGCEDEDYEIAQTESETKSPATCTKGEVVTYIAVFEREVFGETSKDVTLDNMLDHTWGDPEYIWSDDLSTVTRKRTCTACGEVDETTVNTTRKVIKEPTDTEDGEAEYTAVFDDGDGVVTKTMKSTIPAKGRVKGEYEDLTGDIIHEKGSGKSETFRFGLIGNGAGTMDHYVGFDVDGEAVPADKASVTNGSVKIELYSDYLDSLSAGKHTLKVTFDDGEISKVFTIIEKGGADEETTPTPNPTPTETPTPTATPTAAPAATGTPATGEAASSAAFMFGIVFLSSALFVLVVRRKRLQGDK